MPAMFTDEEREEIRNKLIQTGYELFESATLRKASVSEITRRCNIAKGSFYNFFPSKHAFAVTIIQEALAEKMEELIDLADGREKIPVDEFMPWYRTFFREDVNIYFRLKVEDVLWLRDNMEDDSMFSPAADLKEMEFIVSKIDGIREDIDLGVLVNFNKMIYAMAQNRDTFCEDAMQKNIDLILHTMKQYMKGEIA